VKAAATRSGAIDMQTIRFPSRFAALAAAVVAAGCAGPHAVRAEAGRPDPQVVAAARAACEQEFTPAYAQSGKDVIWVPTPDALVQRMLEMAAVGPDDVVVDLGSGDGKIAIAAARDFGARARGIEYDERMVRLANCYAAAEGVADRATFERADIFASDFSDATVVTTYLLPRLMMKLRPTFLELEPGTRIVSNAYHLDDWGADDVARLPSGAAWFWIVPADAAGQWRFEPADGGGADEGRFVASISQAYQHVGTKIRPPGSRRVAEGEGRLRGRELELEARQPGGRRFELRGTVHDDRIEAVVNWAGTERRYVGTRIAPGR
jgi:methylase of polypeptide subunit release factors